MRVSLYAKHRRLELTIGQNEKNIKFEKQIFLIKINLFGQTINFLKTKFTGFLVVYLKFINLQFPDHIFIFYTSWTFLFLPVHLTFHFESDYWLKFQVNFHLKLFLSDSQKSPNTFTCQIHRGLLTLFTCQIHRGLLTLLLVRFTGVS